MPDLKDTPADSEISPDFSQSDAEAHPPLPLQEEKQKSYFQKFSDLRGKYRMEWLVKGFIPLTGIGVLYGDSTSGKTFLAIELALAIARGQTFFGYKTKQRPVVYICLEDKIGFLTRLEAWEKANNSTIPDNLDFRLADFQLTKIEEKDIQHFPDDCLIILDTLNASERGLEENSSKDMGKVIEAMERLSKATKGFFLLIHHCGKDATKGMRGHSSLYAALDTAIEVSHKQDIRSWRVDKNKHGQSGISANFALRVIQLGQDEDGDPIASCIVESCEAQSNKEGLPQALQEALSSLEHALAEAGTDEISIQKWREKWEQEYSKTRKETPLYAKQEKESERGSFNYRRKELVKRGYVAINQEMATILRKS